MGILADALSISLGILIGSCCKNKIKFKINQYFAIAIMMISLLGLIENIFTVSSDRLFSGDTIIVVLSFIVGAVVGDFLHIDEITNRFTKGNNTSPKGFLDAVFVFGIGGLQIGGPILLAVNGDNSQLYLKAMLDFPFALLIGASYGKIPMLSCIPVALLQGLIALAAYFFGGFISQSMIMSLCAVGFIILFFTGFNMISKSEYKIKNTNMVPSMIFVILFYILKAVIL